MADIFVISNMIERIDNQETNAQDSDLRYGMIHVNERVPGDWLYDEYEFNFKNFSFDRYDKNPTLTIDHSNSVMDIVGRVEEHEVNDAGIKVGFKFMQSEKGNFVKSAWDGGYINALSSELITDYENLTLIEEDNKWILRFEEATISGLSIVTTPRDEDSLRTNFINGFNKYKGIKEEDFKKGRNTVQPNPEEIDRLMQLVSNRF